MKLRTACTGGMLLLLTAGSPVVAQALVPATGIAIEVAASPLLGDGQTVKLTSAQLRLALATTLGQDGLRIRSDLAGPRLHVGVLAYDSGPYLGFAKKATMTLSYRLEIPGLPVTTWTDACQARAGVDMQNPDARNRLAVDMCLATLAGQLSRRLLSPPGETLVQ